MEENNYLWDRSGEPDPEIKELEDVLGTLRYQPRPLTIPEDLRISRRRKFFPALAIAAAIALFAVAITIWFSIYRQTTPATVQAGASQPRPTMKPENPTPERELVVKNEPPREEVLRSETPKNFSSRKPNRRIRAVQTAALTPQELADKEQVLLALRLASAKLNIAQRRAQGAPPPNQIRNHRIG